MSAHYRCTLKTQEFRTKDFVVRRAHSIERQKCKYCVGRRLAVATQAPIAADYLLKGHLSIRHPLQAPKERSLQWGRDGDENKQNQVRSLLTRSFLYGC